MRQRKFLTLALVFAMITTLFAACGGSGDQGSADGSAPTSQSASADSAASGDAEPAATAGGYSMFMRSTYAEWIDELLWYDEAEKRLGITVDYIKGPEEFNDFYAEVDQRILSDTLPDATMTRLTETNVYGPQGVFADLAPHIQKYAPNLQAYIDANPTYKALVTNSEGAIYGLVKETPIFADLIGYRADHFEKAGVDAAAVVTVNDFTDAMRKLKAHFGAENPNYYPLCGREHATRFAAWFDAASNISAEGSHGIYINGRYKDDSIDIMSEGAYTMTETMKLWYDEGLINPEWVQGTAGEADWEATMLNGNGSIFYDYYNRAEWFMQNGGPEADPDYQMGVLNFPKAADGSVLEMTTSTEYNNEIVTAVSAKCDEAKIATILKFIDYFYSEEGIILSNYGVEGESFEIVDGEYRFIADYATEESKPAGEKKWSFLSDRLTVCKPVDDAAFFKWNSPLIAEAAGRLFVEENMQESYTLVFTEEQSREVANLYATVYDAQKAGLTAFINGGTELTPESWAAFQAEMNTMGLSRIEEIQLAAFQAMYS